MNRKEHDSPWEVVVDPSAVQRALRQVDENYSGVARSDMLGWLKKFMVAVREDPLSVLGAPPMQMASDPDVMLFPGDRHAKISGLAKAYKARHLIYVYDIHVISGKS